MNAFSSVLSMLVPISMLLWGVVALVAIVFCIFSAIMFWHWKLYSTGRFTTVTSMTAYLVVGFGLLGVMVGSSG